MPDGNESGMTGIETQTGLDGREMLSLVGLRMSDLAGESPMESSSKKRLYELWGRATETQRHRADAWAMHAIDLYGMDREDLKQLISDARRVLCQIEGLPR